MMKSFALLFVLTILSTNRASAYNLHLSGDGGKDYSGRWLYFSHELDSDDEVSVSSWSLDLGVDQTVDSATSENISSSHVGADLKAALGSSFTGSFGVKSCDTGAVKFSNRGLKAGLAYRFDFGDDRDDDAESDEDESDDGFRPGVTVGLTMGRWNIRQNVEFEVLGASLEETFLLRQSSATIEIKWDALSWLRAGFETTGYSYDQETGRLADSTDSRFLNRRAQDVVNTIYGLPKAEAKLSFTFRPHDDWTFDLGVENATTLIDGYRTRTTSLDASYQVSERWNLDLGVSRAVYDESHWDSASLGLGYEF